MTGPSPEAAVNGSRQVLVQGHFTARACSLHGPSSSAARSASLGLGVLALRPRQQRALRWIAVQPLLLARQIADLTEDSPRRIGRTLDVLLALGLIATDTSGPRAVPARRRYVLTPRGLDLLAAGAGLAPRDYRHYTGSIAGVLPLTPGLSDGSSASTRDQRVQGTHLAWICRYLDHTIEMHSLFLRFLHAARSARTIELEEWKGEWACTRTFDYDGSRHVLRPDAYGRYRAAADEVPFFLELDRGTYGTGPLRRKLESYSLYRASGAWTRQWSAFPTLLMVCAGEGRLRTALRLNSEAATAHFTGPVPLLVTTFDQINTHGPLAAIWRQAAQKPPRPLLLPTTRAGRHQDQTIPNPTRQWHSSS